nr:hypothetical protein [Tanacetum cinerariifolium]
MVDFIEASPLRIVPLFDTMLIQEGEGSGTPTEPHHIPSQEAQPSSHTHISSPSIPTVTSVPTIPIPTVIPSKTTPIKQYTRRARIAQSSALPPERVKQLEVREGVATTNSRYDASIKGRSMDEGEAATERVSDDTEEMATVLTSMDVAIVLAKEQLEKENQRRAEQIAKDAEIARIHAEEELQSMIDGLDSNNETVAKYLEEYRQFSSELHLERRIELISDL